MSTGRAGYAAMPLVLLNVDRETFLPLHERAETGDLEAAAAIENLWIDHRDDIIDCECFLCASPLSEWPPRSLIVPDYQPANTKAKGSPGKAQLIVMPLCTNCFELPKMRRWGRALKLLRAMWSVRASATRGRRTQVHFDMNPARLRGRPQR